MIENTCQELHLPQNAVLGEIPIAQAILMGLLAVVPHEITDGFCQWVLDYNFVSWRRICLLEESPFISTCWYRIFL